MKALLIFIVMLSCAPLIAQGSDSSGSTILDSLYAIPELDGDMAANTSGVPFSPNTTTYEFLVGDLGYPYENCFVRSFISFPLPVIPSGYSLQNATMRLYQHTSRGKEQMEDSTYVTTFFPYWDVAGGDTIKCIVSHIDYDISLDLGDWAKGDAGNPYTYNPNVGEITRMGIDEPGNHGEAGYRYLDITDCVLQDLAIGSIFSQYRIAFQIDSDYDCGADFVAFASMENVFSEYDPIMLYTLNNPTSVSDDISPDMLVDVISSPNPFSSWVTFDISIKSHTELSIKLFNLKGRVVKELGPTPYSKGTHNININTQNLSSGIYLLQVKAGSEIITKKITCLK